MREHAWLDSLADAGLVTDASVYDRLARDSAPSHHPIVDLGSDNDSIASMDETSVVPSTSGQDPAPRRTEITLGEISSMPPSSRPEPIPDHDDLLHFGIWLPLDYSSGLKNTVICKG